MVEAIAKEIQLQKSFIPDEVLDTIYFGGGTPSILEANDLKILYNAIEKSFNITGNPEITLEANPDDLSTNKLKELKSFGINRLSIGIQSFNDNTLRFLNRAHNSNEAIKCVEQSRAAGFDNISIDLIFSIPGQNMKNLGLDLAKALELFPEHISVYSLTVEPKTVFGNWQSKGKFVQKTDEESAEQFEFIINGLERSNYEQYEISNFCRNNNYSRHNTAYWKNINYLGVGPGAHSFNGKNRQFNILNNHKYMKSLKDGIIPFEIDELDEKSMANEYLLTSLRTKWGCNLDKLKYDFGYLLMDRCEKINHHIKNQLILKKENSIYLTRKGKFIADDVISDLFWI